MDKNIKFALEKNKLSIVYSVNEKLGNVVTKNTRLIQTKELDFYKTEEVLKSMGAIKKRRLNIKKFFIYLWHRIKRK